MPPRSSVVPRTPVSPDPPARSEAPALVDAPSPPPSSAEVLAVLARQAMRWTKANGSAIALEANGVVTCQASAGETAPPVGATLDKDTGLSGLCLRTGSVLTCDDAYEDPRVSSEVCRRLAIRSIVTVPISNGEGVSAGLLEVFSREPRAFDDRAVAFLQKLAHLIALAVHSSADASPSRAPATIANTCDFDEVARPSAPVLDVEDDSTVPHAQVTSPEPAESGVFNAPNFALEEPANITKFAIAASAVALAAALVPAGLSVHQQVQVPPPPRVAVVSAPELQSSGAAGSLVSEQETGSEAARSRSEVDTTTERRNNQPVNADQQYELATALAEGRGVEQDLVQAYAWYVIAGMNGNTASDGAIKALTARMPESSISDVRLRLGEMFQQGTGVPKDLASAYFWFSLAEAAGNADAAARKKSLEAVMTGDQVMQAQTRAQTWLAERTVGR